MRVSSLALINYRNYDQLDLDLSPGINLFIGKNGQGKTNLVEAIRYCSTLSSHRSPTSALIAADTDQAHIGLGLENDGKTLKLGIELNRAGSNRHSVNGNLVRKSSEILGGLTTVIFSPEDIDLIRKDPSTRRAFLNELSIQLRPAYFQTLSDYERVLKQRNALLKSARGKSVDMSTLELWDDQLIFLASQIVKNREQLINSLLPLLRHKYATISNSQPEIDLFQLSSINVDYRQLEADEIKQHLRMALDSVRQDELDRGVTLIGPQRDDLQITLSGLSSKEHSSQGEAWSLALSMKLASAELIAESSATGKPVIILDDVFSVLDAERRKALTEFMNSYEQVLITAAVEDDVPLTSNASKFIVESGRVE